MKYEPETVKGFQDFLPPASQKRDAVKKIVEKYFMLYGFLPVETPTIEFDELMRPENSEGMDEAISDRFRLQDRGGRNLGLRYEFTFQLARIFKQTPNIKLPLRRYQIGQVFRDEPIGAGRFREFTQCDADIVGDDSIESEAECLAMASDILKELKVEFNIVINSRKLMNSLLDSVQIGQSNKLHVLREIDKIEKIGSDTVKANLKKYADANQIITLFKLLEKDLDFFAKNIFDGAEDIKRLQQLSKQYGFKVAFSPLLVRGLSYYSGNVVEIRLPDKSTICGGGRYDNVAGKFINRSIPGFGISFGLERLTTIAKINPETTKAIVISLEQAKEAIKISQRLRKEDISCITSFDKPGKALEFANSYQIPYAIFIGKDEIIKKKFKLKNMASGEEKLLSETGIIRKLRSSAPKIKADVKETPVKEEKEVMAEDLL